MKIKLCGIRRTEDAEYLREFPPDYAGFVFAPSRRRISHEKAAELRNIIPACVRTVGVFVDSPPEEMAVYSDVISVWQLHGSEDESCIKKLRMLIPGGAEIWKAVRVRSVQDIEDADNLSADMLLLDAFSGEAHGGTGKTFDHRLIRGADIKKPFFLAGGINSSNIREVIGTVSPYGADISSGIETDGVKDRSKIEEIMKIIGKA